jgi:hypothetical protein
MTRDEHVQWCKERALAYLAEGELTNAFASVVRDLNKHPETKDHAAIELGVLLKMTGGLSTAQEMRDFINGFN